MCETDVNRNRVENVVYRPLSKVNWCQMEHFGTLCFFIPSNLIKTTLNFYSYEASSFPIFLNGFVFTNRTAYLAMQSTDNNRTIVCESRLTACTFLSIAMLFLALHRYTTTETFRMDLLNKGKPKLSLFKFYKVVDFMCQWHAQRTHRNDFVLSFRKENQLTRKRWQNHRGNAHWIRLVFLFPNQRHSNSVCPSKFVWIFCTLQFRDDVNFIRFAFC